MATRSTTEQAVGAAIRALRMSNEWSLAELGKRLRPKRSRQYVQRVEKGTLAAPASVYADFARALGVGVRDLFPVSRGPGDLPGEPPDRSA